MIHAHCDNCGIEGEYREAVGVPATWWRLNVVRDEQGRIGVVKHYCSLKCVSEGARSLAGVVQGSEGADG